MRAAQLQLCLARLRLQVYSTNERKSCSQTNVSLARKRVANIEIVQGLATKFAKVQGFHFFLEFFGSHF